MEDLEILSDEKINIIKSKLRQDMNELCTSCQYCMHCPEDIIERLKWLDKQIAL